jgi:uncharacterized alkaline shock family protein YloU
VDQNLGKVTIAPNVLVTIVQKTSMAEPGVAQLCDNVPGVKRLLGIHTVSRGVGLSVADNLVTVNVHLIARRGVDLLQMGRNLQSQISRAMRDIVGMEVREVNIHIDDIATELAAEENDKKAKAG